jgi:hypothetical protein
MTIENFMFERGAKVLGDVIRRHDHADGWNVASCVEASAVSGASAIAS